MYFFRLGVKGLMGTYICNSPLLGAVGRSSDGRPTIATVSCSASVDEVKVQFGGGARYQQYSVDST